MRSSISKYLSLAGVGLVVLCIGCSSGGDRIRSPDEVLQKGSELYHQYACITCHSLEGKEIYGPPLNGLYMQEVEVIREGKVLTLVADRDYLQRAIEDPRFEEVRGFENKDMPEVLISKEEIKLLVDFLVLKK